MLGNGSEATETALRRKKRPFRSGVGCRLGLSGAMGRNTASGRMKSGVGHLRQEALLTKSAKHPMPDLLRTTGGFTAFVRIKPGGGRFRPKPLVTMFAVPKNELSFAFAVLWSPDSAAAHLLFV
jgi:hypothetical protein